jgi:hypothetical protein
MGNTNDSASDTASHTDENRAAGKQQAPSPKGGDAGKPTIAASSVSPEPKSARGSKPAIDASSSAPAPKQGGVENPTYRDAKDYVNRYFRRQAELSDLFWKAANAGFEAFKITTSVEYNKTNSLAFELFEAAIASVSGGQAVLAILEQVKTGEHIKRLLEAVEKAKHWTERAAGVKEGVEKTKAIGENKEAETAAQESGNFKIETAKSLVDLSADSMLARWANEDKVNEMIGGLKFADASRDVDKLVEDALGPMPDAKMIEAVKEQATDQYEYKLYYQYYAKGGIGLLVINIDDDAQSATEIIEHVPDKVLSRISELGHMDDFQRGVKAVNKEERHQRYRGSKF